MPGLKVAEDGPVLQAHRACIRALQLDLCPEVRQEVVGLRDAYEAAILSGIDDVDAATGLAVAGFTELGA